METKDSGDIKKKYLNSRNNQGETTETPKNICNGNITRKQEEILNLITQYRYMNLSQIKRKLWGQDDRKAQIQLSKHFNQKVIDSLKAQGILKEKNGILRTNARGEGSPHQISIVDCLLLLESEAKKQSFGFQFTYDWIDENLRPDAAVIFTDTNRYLLCYLEVHLETEPETTLSEKLEKYSRINVDQFKELWKRYADNFSLRFPRNYGFRVIVFSHKKRVFSSKRFVSIVFGEESIGEKIFLEERNV